MQPLPSSSSGDRGTSGSCSLQSLPLRWSVNDAYNDEPALLSLIKGHNYDPSHSAFSTTITTTTTTVTTPSSSTAVATAVVPQDNTESIMTETTDCKKFDLIIACDILFLKDCHTDLIATLRRLIDPVGGKVLLLQPRRGMLHLLQIL